MKAYVLFNMHGNGSIEGVVRKKIIAESWQEKEECKGAYRKIVEIELDKIPKEDEEKGREND